MSSWFDRVDPGPGPKIIPALRRSRALLFLLLVPGAGLSWPGAAQARTPRELRDGVSAYNQMEYGPALMYLKSALQRGGDSDALAQGFFYLGCTYLALDKPREAREAYETLLSFAPTFVPSRRFTSPKISRFFARVREAYDTPAGPPAMAHRVPRRGGSRLTRLRLRIKNRSPRLRPVLRYRESSSPGFFSMEAKGKGERLSFVVPTGGGGKLHYYFVLMDRHGVVVRQLGVEDRPFRVKIAAADDEPSGGGGWYTKWWVWTIAGAVVAGTGLGIGLGIGLSGEETSSAKITILRRNASGGSVPIFSK